MTVPTATEQMAYSTIAGRIAAYLRAQRTTVQSLRAAIAGRRPLLVDAIRATFSASEWAAVPPADRVRLLSLDAAGQREQAAHVLGALAAIPGMLPFATLLHSNPSYVLAEMNAAREHLRSLG